MRHLSVRGQILCVRKILDIHFSTHKSKYMWETNYVTYLLKNQDTILLQDQVSVEPLFYFWNAWEETIGRIFEYLDSGCADHDVYGKFCLDYFGVTVRREILHVGKPYFN